MYSLKILFFDDFIDLNDFFTYVTLLKFRFYHIFGFSYAVRVLVLESKQKAVEGVNIIDFFLC